MPRSEERMLKAATTLFGRQGYTSTTLEQIGAEAGYSSALVSSDSAPRMALSMPSSRASRPRSATGCSETQEWRAWTA